MLEIIATTGNLTVPIWVAGAASALFVAAIVLAIGRAGVATVINMLFCVGIVAIAVSAGFYQLVRLIETRVLSRFQPASGA